MNNVEEIENIEPIVSLQFLLLGGLAILAGTVLAAIFLPEWLPGLTTSLTGDSPKAFWYLSRGSAMIGFVLLWASMAFGLIITNRMARLWPGGPIALDIHQYLSLVGLGFGLFHGTILLGDHYIHETISQILLPFANHVYKPFWVGLGQLGFYLWALLVGSFYIRKRIGGRTWRMIHYASFAAFAMVVAHSFMSGSDTGTPWASAIYWIGGGSFLFLLFYRVLATTGNKKGGNNRRAPARTGTRK
jgi:predicted ferric reductase